MLKQRLITAAILLPLVVSGILLLDSRAFAVALGVVVLLAAWEWASLMKNNPGHLRFLYVVVMGVLLLGAGIISSKLTAHPLWIIPAVIFWLLVCVGLMLANRSAVIVGRHYPLWLLAVAGILVLVPAWLSLAVLHRETETGPWQVLFLMVLIWCADSGAYMAGRRWGRHKLAALISPGKTWEGVLGGVTVAVIPALLAAVYWYDSPFVMVMFLIICLLTVMISVVGDLFESLVKRQARVKDSGTLLPGHGGILDRIDSLTSAAPVYVLGLIMIGQAS